MFTTTLMKKTLPVVLVLLIAVGAGYYIYTDFASTRFGEKTESDQSVITVETESSDSQEEENSERTTIPDSTIPIPDLDRPIIFSVSLPQEAKDIYRNQINILTESLKKNPNMPSDWLQLGISRKAIGDYEGAVEAWEYVNKISPKNNVSFYNLGDLYHFYLKEFAKSEQNFFTSRKNSPSYVPVYRALHELYIYSYKQNTSLAEDILLEGLKNTGNDLDLQVLLAGYYKGKGAIENARTYYKKAQDQALIRGNQSLADLLQEEIDNL